MKGKNYPRSSSGRVTNARFLIRQQGCVQLPPGLPGTAWDTALVGKEQEEANTKRAIGTQSCLEYRCH